MRRAEKTTVKKAWGKIIFQGEDLSSAKLLEVEHTLNNEIAALVYKKHGVGIRVHVE